MARERGQCFMCEKDKSLWIQSRCLERCEKFSPRHMWDYCLVPANSVVFIIQPSGLQNITKSLSLVLYTSRLQKWRISFSLRTLKGPQTWNHMILLGVHLDVFFLLILSLAANIKLETSHYQNILCGYRLAREIGYQHTIFCPTRRFLCLSLCSKTNIWKANPSKEVSETREVCLCSTWGHGDNHIDFVVS